MTKRNTKRDGFSLIELLFAMLFLSVIVFGVIKLQTSNLTLSNTKRLELKANSHAIQGLAIVGALGHGKVDGIYVGASSCGDPDPPCDCEITYSGSYGFACTGVAEAIPPTPNKVYDRTIIIDPEPGTQNLFGAYMITSLVEWTDSSGHHSASAKRIIFN